MDVLKEALKLVEAGNNIALITVTKVEGSSPREAGAMMLVKEDGSIYSTIGGGSVEHSAIREALEAIKVNRPITRSWNLNADLEMACGGMMEVFIQPLVPSDEFVIFGAGHISFHLAPLVKKLGFEVIITDPRPELMTEQRFPNCKLIIASPAESFGKLNFNRHTWSIVATHAHTNDEEIIQELVKHDLGWIGLVASKTKVAKYFKNLRAIGVSEHIITQISTPVGLDIGAETPEEIAISIAAEIIMKKRGGSGSPLKELTKR